MLSNDMNHHVCRDVLVSIEQAALSWRMLEGGYQEFQVASEHCASEKPLSLASELRREKRLPEDEEIEMLCLLFEVVVGVVV